MTIIEYNTRLNEARLPILAEGQKYRIDGRKQYRNPGDIARLAAETIGLKDAAEEYVYALSFNAKNRLTGLFEISHGTVNASICSPREIMQKLLMIGAVFFVLVHNHPSGDPEPSQEDNNLTIRLSESGKFLGIPLMDHIIVGNGEDGGRFYYSFREENEMED